MNEPKRFSLPCRGKTKEEKKLRKSCEASSLLLEACVFL